MKIDLENLPTDLDFLHHMIVDLVKENLSLQDQNEYLENKLALLKAKLFGASSEKINKAKLEEQISEIEQRLEDNELFADNIVEESDDASTDQLQNGSQEGTEGTSDTKKNRARRKKLPAHLPREDNVINPDSVCPECGGESFRRIDDDISEILEYVPSSFKVIRNIRPRCACTTCEKIVQAFPPSQTIDKGKAGPGLLAHILLQKYCNHLPFYRQSQIYGYEDIDLPRSTMSGWSGQCSRLLQPLVDEIKKKVFSSPQIHGDDTIVKVLAPGLGRTKTGRIWVYVRDGRPHGDTTTAPAACYFYSPDRKGERPQEHLKDYTGIMHADAYAGYDKLYIDDDDKENSADTEGIEDGKDGKDRKKVKNPEAKITEAACWDHTRRKFYEITQTNDKASIALDTLEQMGAIYGIEEEIRGLDPDKRKEARQKRSKEKVDKLFRNWKKYYAVLPKKSPTAKAIAYAINNEAALKRFLDNGKIEIGNNAAERAMRGIALGRKNWMFAGSDKGGETAAAMYTIIETVKLNDINPWKYLRHVLATIQDQPHNKMADLLPWNVKLK